jgi:hypothetical protein
LTLTSDKPSVQNRYSVTDRDFSVRPQVPENIELVFHRHLGIDSMQLIKINLVDPQPTQAGFASGSQVFWSSVFNPLVGAWPRITAFGGDYQAFRIGMQSFRGDCFTHAGTIRVRSVDKIDSQFDSPPQNPNSLRPVCGLAPNSISRDSHRPESQSGNTKIVSYQEFARLFSRCLASLNSEVAIRHKFSFQGLRLMRRTALHVWSRETQAASQKNMSTCISFNSENYRLPAHHPIASIEQP